jgi:D-psicose/D-tagatose/L-ribulose 3-epimerase
MLFGVHALVWTGALDAESLRAAIRNTKEVGYDFIELPLLDPFSFDVTTAKRLLAEYDLPATASLGLNTSTDISSEDAETSAAGEKLLLAAVDAVREMGGAYLCGVIYSALRKYMAPATERGVENGLSVLRRVADHAAAAGITLGLEVVNRYETNIMNTGREALRYLDRLGRDNVVVHLDTYHMNIEEPDFTSPVEICGDRLGYVHIGENHRGYLGSGNIAFGEFFRALHRAGYDGPVTFESFSSAVVDEELSRMLGIWRNLWSDSRDLAEHALGFMRSQTHAVETIGQQ